MKLLKAPSRVEALNKPINQCLNNQRNLYDRNQNYLRIQKNQSQENLYLNGYIGLGGLRIT